MKNKAMGLLLALVMAGMLTGCGGEETIHTSAESTESGETAENIEDEAAEDTESGDAEADGGNEDTEADGENGDAEDAGTDGEADGEAAADGQSEDDTADSTAEERTNATVAQMEIDEATKNELTAELLKEQEMDTSVMENTRATKGCTFTLPDTFEESEDVPGMYVTKRYPIDASTIYYVALDQDVSLQLMTEETFKAQAEANFRQAYGEDIEITIDSFERIQIEGYPAFRILCHYQVGEVEITQLEYAINADKSYVITYSQTSDYDRMEEYEASAETIRLEY